MADFGPTLVLALAVIGFVSLRWASYWGRYQLAVLEWQENLFWCTVFGAGLFVYFRLCLLPFLPHRLYVPMDLLERVARVPAPASEPVDVVAWVKTYLPFPFSGSLLATLAVGVALGWVSRVRWTRVSSLRRVLVEHGGGLRNFLLDAGDEGAPVMLTMSNRKVYVGFVLAAPGLQKQEYVKILPTISGSRDDTTMRVVFTTPYTRAFEDIQRRQAGGEPVSATIDAFGIILPVDEIASACRFDAETYGRYFARSRMRLHGTGPADSCTPLMAGEE